MIIATLFYSAGLKSGFNTRETTVLAALFS